MRQLMLSSHISINLNQKYNDLQVDEFPVCQRCRREGSARQERVKKAKADHQTITLKPMKYSKKNTGLEFRYEGSDPLVDPELIDESLISLISAIVTIQKVVGMCKSETADNERSMQL